MRPTTTLPRFFGVLVCAGFLSACSPSMVSPAFSASATAVSPAYGALSAIDLVDAIRRGDGSVEAREALRARGPQGLDAALDGYAKASAEGADPAVLERLSAAADAAGKQRDEIHTRLYWYTDLEEAQRAAQREHKPILSLRMLGHLDDELSCANSRFFRTTLYPDAEVQRRLHDQWILHWSSERPVPVVTIDYGDGRIVRRTITGNSIHYVLEPNGHVVDAIPGLYSASAFASALDEDLAVAMSGGDRAVAVTTFQSMALERDRTAWAAIGMRGALPTPIPPIPTQFLGYPSPAVAAIPAAPAKAFVEMPVVRSLVPAVPLPTPNQIEAFDWTTIAATERQGVTISPSVLAIMRAKAPLDWSSGRPAPLDDEGFEKLVAAYEDHVALDMARNKYAYHPAIRAWLRDDPSLSLTELNERVYAELFLTPANDPWLGLVPPVAYSGIQGDGFAPKDP
ncbi:MAG: hypothetical protein U0414_02755 [Polyangiaceae bacterium]